MEKIKYYKDLDNGFLLAYESSCEFFVRYLPGCNEWEACPVSFLAFSHERRFEQTDRAEALRITAGNLPDKLLRDYLDTLGKNTR